MKAIFARQPFAYLLAVGCKDVENYSWPTNYRGPLFIVAAEQDPTPVDICYAEQIGKQRGFVLPPTYDLGGIVGIAHLTDCVTTSQSPWHKPDSYGYVLTQARPVPFVPYPGARQVFKMDGLDQLWDDSLPPAPNPRPVRKPPREWFEKFQQRIDRVLAAQQI